ncbi:acyl carrier protein [Dasania sp. GY-19]|uniref:Acyl carrier protein n=1 Tax=Dasania phycosphaerae TaxID=2950436 RepID=A0A9J6RSS5_9GAMM|nr:acyl carrier protein [Dasania phycosphaerae]MCZ0867141.1 acyl carrier protein [Dasania phycosphaerae]
MTMSRADISEWMSNYLESQLDLTLDWRSKSKTFGELGLSSAEVLEMVFSLSEWLSEEIDETIPFEYPTIETLSEYLANG